MGACSMTKRTAIKKSATTKANAQWTTLRKKTTINDESTSSTEIT
jgi:hypothetical protein